MNRKDNYTKVEPRKVWMVSTDPWKAHAYERTIIGETSRSWVCGSEWAPWRYAKKEYRIITDAEAREIYWANRVRRAIARSIEYSSVTPAQLRQIAAIIGYEEQSNAKR